ncbi:MAG: class I SAM-dependent methyltransferase, partial [Myxococcota bacterium]|nr:class I SAM-dependent methyltransferase [Myxococcota bacterium]
HLKILQDLSWIKKRTEKTTSFFSFQPPLLDPHIQNLWNIVREQSTDIARDDVQKAKTILALREVDSEAFFQKIGHRWNELRKSLFGNQFLLPTLLQMLPPNLVVADIGCGTGDSLLALSPYVNRLIALDRSDQMLSIARQRTAHLKNITLQQGSLGKLPVESNSVDVALCVLILHHIPDIDLALKDLHRILKSNGKLIILDMCEHSLGEFQKTMGHQHLGFSKSQLNHPQFQSLSWTTIPKDKNTLGPQLFTAAFRAL